MTPVKALISSIGNKMLQKERRFALNSTRYYQQQLWTQTTFTATWALTRCLNVNKFAGTSSKTLKKSQLLKETSLYMSKMHRTHAILDLEAPHIPKCSFGMGQAHLNHYRIKHPLQLIPLMQLHKLSPITWLTS